MKLFILRTIFLLFTTSLLNAQGRLITDIIDPYQQNADLLYDKKAQNNIAGSPFYMDWSLGIYTDTENKNSMRLLLKYNAFNDELYKKNERNEEEIIPKSKVQSFSFTHSNTGKEEKFIKIVLAGNARTGETYFKLCYAGNKAKLWEKVRKTIEKAVQSSNSSAYGTLGAAQDKFVDDNLILIEFANQPIQFVEKNRKKFAAMFKDKTEILEDFMKKENIKLRNNPEDYIKVIAKYEALTKF